MIYFILHFLRMLIRQLQMGGDACPMNKRANASLFHLVVKTLMENTASIREMRFIST